MSDTSHAFCIYNPISLGRGSINVAIMGLLDKIKDNFTKAEFNVSPQKKLKTLSAEFENAFGVELVFYKGKQIADGGLTLKQLNDKTTKNNTKPIFFIIKNKIAISPNKNDYLVR